MAKDQTMTFKIDGVEKKHLADMAKTDMRSSSDFIRWLLAREWKFRVERNPTVAAVDEAGGEWIKEYPQRSE